MASSQGWSNGPEWKDVADMLLVFERQNTVSIELTLCSETTNGVPDLSIVAKAWQQGKERREAQPLACERLTWLAGRWRTMRGLVTYLLYQLDFQLAEDAWTEKQDPSA